MGRTISASVGVNAANRKSDIITVQELLNKVPPAQGGPEPQLKVDGLCWQKTQSAIRNFQSKNMGHRWPDGRVDPAGKTLARLNEFDTSVADAVRIDPIVIIGINAPSLLVPPTRDLQALAPTRADNGLALNVLNVRAIVRGNPYVAVGARVDDGMPPSLPPTKTYAVLVTVEPALTGGDFIELSIVNNSPLHGTATIFPTRITHSGTVTVRVGAETTPGHAGRLQIQARLNGKDVKATSEGFSVCAHPLNFRVRFHKDHFDNSGAGMIVKETLESDSSRFADLDRVEMSEAVESFRKDEPPFHEGSGFVKNSKYLPAIPPPGTFMGDTHVEPRPKAGPKGVAEKIQAHMFRCLRCGAADKAVPNSGFDIKHEVFGVGKQFKHRVTKKGEQIGIWLPSGITVRTKAGFGHARSPDHDL